MPLLNILLARDYISCFSSDFTTPDSFRRLPENINYNHKAVSAYLSEFVSNLNLSENVGKNVNVNLILDYNFVRYYHFTLPPVNRRKVAKIVGFELEETLLDSVDENQFDYHSKTFKQRSTTEAGVYTINKEFLNSLIETCKKDGLELKGIFPLNNLANVKFQEARTPQDHIYITLEEKFARVFVYKAGFLIDFSTVLFPESPTVDGSAQECLQTKIDLINQKIITVSLYNDSDYQIILDEETRRIIKVGDNQTLDLIDSASAEDAGLVFTPMELKDLAQPSIINKARRINLLKSNVLIAKELKKHAKPLILSASVIGVCLIIYIGLVVYKGITNYREYKKLDQEYTAYISKYLSKGTSRANALYILKDKVKALKEKNEKYRKFAKREYNILTLLKQFSLFKKTVPSFLLDNFYLADNAIRIQGQVASLDDFEKIKERLRDIFPKKNHSISYNQESRGKQTIRFKITIRRTPSSAA